MQQFSLSESVCDRLRSPRRGLHAESTVTGIIPSATQEVSLRDMVDCVVILVLLVVVSTDIEPLLDYFT